MTPARSARRWPLGGRGVETGAHGRYLAASALVLSALCLHAAEGPASQPRPGERLSDWLSRAPLARPVTGQPYPLGLMWSHPAERPGQAALQRELLADLQRPGLELLVPLAAWVQSLPITGRVFLARADVRWLQANPNQDPVLDADASLALPRRPGTVTVLRRDARLCQVPHRAEARASHYLAACAGLAQADDAWVVQPDGRVQVLGVQPWNAQAQEPPAPGAWIWAPAREDGVPQDVSGRLARFLGTQGPAADLPVDDPRRTSRSGAGDLNLTRPPRDLELSASDWGETGLLQTPTARMAPAGHARFHWSSVWPYTRGTVMLQPVDWLEAGFRYTDIANRAYGPGNPQSYKDKSIDFKLRLRGESAFWPQIALGVRDIGGTGYFSGEYLVASKRWGDFDASLGLGWGYLGARGDLGNPLAVLGDRYKQRGASSNVHGGTVNLGALFHGPTALFGGVQWHTPWPGFLLKAEIEGNDYRREPENNPQPQNTPLNVGLVWRPAPWVDLSFGVARGKRIALGATLHGSLAAATTPKLLDPPLPRPLSQTLSKAAAAPRDWKDLAVAVRTHLDWDADAVYREGDRLHLRISSAGGAFMRDRVDKLEALLHLLAPAEVQHFVLHFDPAGLPNVAVLEIDRAQWLRDQQAPSMPSQQRKARAMRADVPQGSPSADGWTAADLGFRWGLAPYLAQVLGGPDAFVLYQTGGIAHVRADIGNSLQARGALQFRLLDNFDKFTNTGQSGLPRVRTYQREYAVTRHITVPHLYLTRAERWGRDQFFMFYGGLLEPMFGGAGVEWMWRPAGAPVSLSIDVNRVRQRAFEQNLSFRPYEATTGHATLRWQTGWQGMVVSPSVGQYLAGDRGATLDVSRTFGNGVVMGAFATRTNASREAFGEGSFDKGIYVTVPFDAMLARSTTGAAQLLWRPLTRDGGAKLGRPTLIDHVRFREPGAFDQGSPQPTGQRRTGDPIFAN
jgi:hypothetical protein